MYHYLRGMILLAGGVILIACSQNISVTTMQGVPSHPEQEELVEVIQVADAHGTFKVSPAIPQNGMVPAGTRLTIKAKPAKGYSLDAIYYTVEGGMWGTTSFEFFKPKATITASKKMWLGATFVENDLVNGLKVTHDLPYAQPGKKLLKYDVYAPKGAKNLPAIVIIHGGGWSSNNEDIMRGLARELAREKKYVVCSIDYRWVKNLDGDATSTSMHQLIEDVFGAIAHIQENASKYGADPSRIAVTGDSAGGHLSAAAAVFADHIGDGGFGIKAGVYEFLPSYLPKGKNITQVKKEISGAIKAAAPSYGVFDAENFKGFMTQTDQAYFDAVSPIKNIPPASQRKIPHFMVRGTKDPIISLKVVQDYASALQTKGHTVTHLEIEGAEHAFFDWKPDTKTRETFYTIGVPYAVKMREFFNGVFYPVQ